MKTLLKSLVIALTLTACGNEENTDQPHLPVTDGFHIIRGDGYINQQNPSISRVTECDDNMVIYEFSNPPLFVKTTQSGFVIAKSTDALSCE